MTAGAASAATGFGQILLRQKPLPQPDPDRQRRVDTPRVPQDRATPAPAVGGWKRSFGWRECSKRWQATAVRWTPLSRPMRRLKRWWS